MDPTISETTAETTTTPNQPGPRRAGLGAGWAATTGGGRGTDGGGSAAPDSGALGGGNGGAGRSLGCCGVVESSVTGPRLG